MAQQIELTIVDDKIKVITPYNADFVAKARNLRGKWADGAWWFDDSIEEYVKEVMLEYFGTTGETPYENCTLQISDYSQREYGGPCILFGRIIARAWGRNSNAKLGDDVVFISGDYTSSGSSRNWCTALESATFLMKNFPKPSLELPNVKRAIEEGWCVVKEDKKKRKKEEVEADIESCKLRLIELEEELRNV